ncbi:MAG: hypothetical protein UR39_C0003G0163 [Candidatus Woesebacteria bacterium GW2011_GWA1_33_30]|uniref:Peptidase S11 D-alanyl-D-alanine carboxypeptidase A N-terminal domain-containing protein n=1 Tax=Candidatus Woesebacteria bacterium GW2011_GWA2_33_28 TaxID=1618561 RepID=A0A0G0A900_9BACT|nr:MAG: hypothetical protein UR38_C0003G0166 [Candidatus Woesebacteria bacterium GW2011_GWA2_33_28]KKP48628.1 MAG: hypothetical protein UR39_C0003G0163 [Candidatus Woesebacteria bacterium GW2011_GWA1_33_30]KKP49767.1 MAG: hypothetical protein UR40_C0004G0166 [Microgenomates group bacterium GW2011_GWC1_33_32]KKP52384.1 MAG: hypothetical protein UR44_C0003G0166 [Candidatus Woesebacteria bacterium GW2011_GWB1_33_38]KKP57114.1 MAG: hypothetical protein UR48_C0023G0013 [Microgenomates group bacteriu
MKNNLLYLALLAFLLISTSALSLSNNLSSLVTYVFPEKKVKAYSPLPVLKDQAKYPILSAQSVMAVDLDSGVTLYEKDPNKTLLPASTTKIVTALVSLDSYNLDRVLKVGKANVVGQKMGLVSGEQLLFPDLLNGLLIYSANDAAEVLASSHPGGRELFIALMNKKVKDLGLNNTHFSNPTGLDNGAQYVTARDLIVVSKYAMKNPIFAKIVGIKEITVKSVDGKITHKLTNVNKLLGSVEGVLGVKTGWTENARENLVTEVSRNGKRVMIVVLGSSDRFGETTELIDWIYNNYSWENVIPS